MNHLNRKHKKQAKKEYQRMLAANLELHIQYEEMFNDNQELVKMLALQKSIIEGQRTIIRNHCPNEVSKLENMVYKLPKKQGTLSLPRLQKAG